MSNTFSVLKDGKEGVRLLSGSEERCATGQNKGNKQVGFPLRIRQLVVAITSPGIQKVVLSFSD